ncbi:hypothetical protein DICA4_E00540 [Diutina catenulata]
MDPHHNPYANDDHPPQERGLLSTISGAAVGGYAGNKMSNGGTLGKIGGALLGAIAANKIEHHFKHDHDAPPQWEHHGYGGPDGRGEGRGDMSYGAPPGYGRDGPGGYGRDGPGGYPESHGGYSGYGQGPQGPPDYNGGYRGFGQGPDQGGREYYQDQAYGRGYEHGGPGYDRGYDHGYDRGGHGYGEEQTGRPREWGY